MSSPSLITPLRAGAFAAFLATAAAGWHLGADPQAKDQPDAEAVPAGKTAARPERHGKSGPPEHVRERMASIRGAATPDARMRATIDLASNLPIDELAEWLKHSWFDTGGGFDLTLFHKIAMERWQREDMEGFIAWSEKNNPGSAYQTINTWAKDDPERALAFFRTHPNPQMEMQALRSIAQTRPDLALSHFREMVADGGTKLNPNNGIDLSFINQLAKQKPAELEGMLDSMPSFWRASVESALVGQKLATSFSDELKNLIDRPDGWKLFQRSARNVEKIDEKLIEALPDLPASWKSMIATNYHSFVNMESASKWLEVDMGAMGFTDEQAKRFQSMALQYTSYREPEKALQKMADIDLGEQERRNMVSNIFANLARKPEQAEKMMELLESDEERKIAQAAMDAQNTASNPMKVETPAQWLEQAGTITPQQSYQLLSTISSWDKNKVAEVTAGFRSMPEEQKAAIAKILSGSNYYSSDGLDPGLQGEAIRYLAGQPKEEPKEGQASPDPFQQQQDPKQLASIHAVKWSMKDPDAASAWVQSLPAGEARTWAQKNLAANWAKYDPDAAQQWIGSLPAKDRTEVQNYLNKAK